MPPRLEYPANLSRMEYQPRKQLRQMGHMERKDLVMKKKMMRRKLKWKKTKTTRQWRKTRTIKTWLPIHLRIICQTKEETLEATFGTKLVTKWPSRSHRTVMLAKLEIGFQRPMRRPEHVEGFGSSFTPSSAQKLAGNVQANSRPNYSQPQHKVLLCCQRIVGPNGQKCGVCVARVQEERWAI